VKIQVIFSRHAQRRAQQRGGDLEEIRRIVCEAVPFAPRWPEAVTAVESITLRVTPIVKYLRRKAVVTTVLPPDAFLKKDTVVVRV